MLTLITFYQLNWIEEIMKLEAIWNNGIVVAERDDEVNRYRVYKSDLFYIALEWYKE